MVLIKKTPSELQHVPQQTLQMCFAAVTENHQALEYVDPEFAEQASLMIAVLENPMSILDIWSKGEIEISQEIFVAAMQKEPEKILSEAWEINMLFEQDVYAAALKLDGTLIQLIDSPQRDGVIDVALNHSPFAIEHLSSEEKTHARCLSVVNRDGMLLEFVIQDSIDICIAAVHQNPMAIKFVDLAWQTPVVFVEAMKKASECNQLLPFMSQFYTLQHWSPPLKSQLIAFVHTVASLNAGSFPEPLVRDLLDCSLQLR
ncbi:hypothetical protein B9Z38_16195 [Limnohabitans sp. MMS-10A-160]|uniref:DUF4116 domain-containing protein n=2 Tax=unclassified Limnohabitans TaxID=2626134 RepID=UPI000D3D20C4|nr:DUF4116 domain-containing protein [Limnohabitans sp. MMS-10A-192]PUE22422.1 hypothetical protein B9Z43_04720 [Limnohabitans sp. MMS-10A-192]PUE22593.1 hypothetical protein B9Z38_16195 [Limnohabitans sp. MMS-10A-160]